MSNALTLARPYARAAFASAQEQSRVPQWSQQLAFAAQVALDPRVNTLLGHPRLQGETLTGLLTPPDNEDAGFARFLALLAENRRLPLLPEIAIGFAELRAEAERVVKVEIVSAAPLDDASLARLRESLR
jgi:F-type H+-transporting ATPase subunit delta